MSETDNVIPFRPRPRSRDEELADVLTDIRDSGDRARRLLGELRARSKDRAEKKPFASANDGGSKTPPTPIAEIRTALEASGERLAAIRRDLEALAHED